MITARTKKQLIVFVIMTLLGVTFVGARYARLDRLFYDSTYTVDATSTSPAASSPAPRSPTAASRIGQVSAMKLTDDGVDVILVHRQEQRKIPTGQRRAGRQQVSGR